VIDLSVDLIFCILCCEKLIVNYLLIFEIEHVT
jgi:hypothetical protein